MSVIWIDPYRFGAAAPGLWTPAEITTVLWLDAKDESTITESGGNVSAWTDKSDGSYTTAITGTPTYSATGLSTGEPAITFGDSAWLTADITGFQSFDDFCIFFVTQTPVAAGANVNSSLYWSFGDAFGGTGTYKFIVLGTQPASALASERQSMFMYPGANDPRVLGSNTYARAANTAVMESHEQGTAGTKWYQNDQQTTINLSSNTSTSTANSPSVTAYTADDLLIIKGRRSNTISGGSVTQVFSEIVALSSIPSTDTRNKIYGYLAHKWGLESLLDSGHPYKSSPPTV